MHRETKCYKDTHIFILEVRTGHEVQGKLYDACHTVRLDMPHLSGHNLTMGNHKVKQKKRRIESEQTMNKRLTPVNVCTHLLVTATIADCDRG